MASRVLAAARGFVKSPPSAAVGPFFSTIVKSPTFAAVRPFLPTLTHTHNRFFGTSNDKENGCHLLESSLGHQLWMMHHEIKEIRWMVHHEIKEMRSEVRRLREDLDSISNLLRGSMKRGETSRPYLDFGSGVLGSCVVILSVHPFFHLELDYKMLAAFLLSRLGLSI